MNPSINLKSLRQCLLGVISVCGMSHAFAQQVLTIAAYPDSPRVAVK